ncbi:MAG: hypothetical protein K8Q97_02285 [Candidatus Andersenbacteria bacterium]|nr:hypothetical protein [Candidatus Andersenbacteria bacterium]
MNVFEQFYGAIHELVLDHWAKALVTLGVMILMALWGGYRAWVDLRNRTFYRRFHFSLNILRDGKLRIRTLDEMDAGEVVLQNSAAVNALIKAAKQTTIDDPFIRLPESIHWIVLNCALNELASLIPSTGLFHFDLGLPTVQEKYVLALTCEKDPDVRTRKVRMMIVRKQTLLSMLGSEFQDPILESQNHSVRVRTLKKMAVLYRDRPEQFLEYEVALAVSAPASSVEPASAELDAVAS